MDLRYAKAYMRERLAAAEARRLAALIGDSNIGTGVLSRLTMPIRRAGDRRQLVAEPCCCAI